MSVVLARGQTAPSGGQVAIQGGVSGQMFPSIAQFLAVRAELFDVANLASWTADQPLCPQTGAADRPLVAEAVLQIGVGDIAATAEGAGREGKTLHARAVGDVGRVVP